MLSWLCCFLLLAPLGDVRHALSHLHGTPAASQHPSHALGQQAPCDLCHLWDMLDATLPVSFPVIAGNPPRLAPPLPTPHGAMPVAGTWFQSRAPPVAA